MPVTVECELHPSKKRWLVMVVCCAASAVLVFAFSLSYWFLVLPGLGLMLIPAVLNSEVQPERIRINGSEVYFWQQDQTTQWCWLGEGCLSSQFIELKLLNAEDEQLKFRIWQDSVSDASWRALNMAFRVNQSHARQLAQGD